jgi:hypothetical protein
MIAFSRAEAAPRIRAHLRSLKVRQVMEDRAERLRTGPKVEIPVRQ